MKLDNDIIRLNDILKSIQEIDGFLQRATLDDRMAQMAVAYEIAIIGEAANKLSSELKSKHSHIPWESIIGMRHRIIHDYGNVSIARLKEAVETHMPLLREQIQAILNEKKDV